MNAEPCSRNTHAQYHTVCLYVSMCMRLQDGMLYFGASDWFFFGINVSTTPDPPTAQQPLPTLAAKSRYCMPTQHTNAGAHA